MLKLLSPGPVSIPEFVRDALNQPVIHHRSSAFENFYGSLLEKLQYLFQTDHSVCTCIGSGTYGVDMAIYSLFEKGEELLVSTCGKFSQRWADYAKTLGIKTHELKTEWGRSPKPEAVLAYLKKNPTVRGLVLTHSETSTGALLDLEEIAFAVKDKYPNILILVDGITSVGALPYFHDAWGIDCSVIASQKALMNPAGLVGFAFSEAAKLKLRQTHASDFQNLGNHLEAAQKNSPAYTPPVQLLYGVKAALDRIEEETLPAVWNRVHQTAEYFRKKVIALGAEIFPASPGDSLTAFYFPGEDHNVLKESLEQDYELILSGGQGELKGKILRISHMGLLHKGDMEEVITAIHGLRQ